VSNGKSEEHGYNLAYRLAVQQLGNIDDIEQQCRNCGARYIAAPKAISLDYLNQPYLISLPGVEISLVGKEEEVPLRDRILILHYFTSAKGTPLSNTSITYRELPEGATYFPTFYARSIRPLVKDFGNKPRQLLDAAGKLGGHEADFADVAVTIHGFSRVPVTFALWQGDNELAPEGNVLFDRTISDYLPTEDIIVLCEIIARRLIKLRDTGGDNSVSN